MTTVTTVAADVAPVVMHVAIIGAQVTAFPAGSGHVAVMQVPAERAPVPAAIVPVFVEVVPVVAHVVRIPSDIMPHGVGKARGCLRERKSGNGQHGTECHNHRLKYQCLLVDGFSSLSVMIMAVTV